MIQPSDLTTAFPEFSDVTTYPVATINFWINQGYAQLNPIIFGDSLDLAVMLYVAHQIVLSARNAKAVAAGGVAGDATGPISSKSVGGVSKGYDIGAVALGNAGIWNSTSYGQRLYQMFRAFGAGGLYAPGPVSTPALGQPYLFGYVGLGYPGYGS